MGAPDPADRVQGLVEDNTADLLAYFLRRVDVAEDAADLLNDTLLVIWRRTSSIPTEATAARMWMFGVGRNVLSTHRRTTRRRSALHAKLHDEVAGTNGSADERGHGPDVHAALAQLEPLDQELIRLVFWDGFTKAQVAVLLDMPEGTVRSRIHRARQRLRRALSTPSLTYPRSPPEDRTSDTSWRGGSPLASARVTAPSTETRP